MALGLGATLSEGPTSEDDYDNIRPSATIIRRGQSKSKSKLVPDATPSGSSFDTLRSLKTGKSGTGYSLDVDDGELREIVQRGLLRAKDPAGKGKRRPKFSDLVFTRKFSTFDRQSEEAASSPFHGFYTLFWMAVFVFMVKIAADNWRKYGNPLGTNEIMHLMFERDVVLLLLSDGIMCGLTGVSWLLQRLTYAGYLDWDRSGWIIQNVGARSLPFSLEIDYANCSS
jgi:sterol O-acyltransferase